MLIFLEMRIPYINCSAALRAPEQIVRGRTAQLAVMP
jgi:hypothetical protein